MPKSKDSDQFIQGNLWQSACHECSVWNICGGAPSAPCGCVKTGKDRYQCHRCHIICRDRRVPPSNGISKDTFIGQITAGMPLHKLTLEQPQTSTEFPSFIPLCTNLLPQLTDQKFIGIPIDKILTAPTKAPPAIRKYVSNIQEAKSYFKAADSTQLIAVLNGKDEFLEALWRMPERDQLYKTLRKTGIKYIIGPTFSVVTAPHVPTSHNVAMVLRHNRIIQELSDFGFTPIPNIYWYSTLNITQWKLWLKKHLQVRVLAFDLSLRSKGNKIRNYLEACLKMLGATKRSFHLFFTGIGTQGAFHVAEILKNTNHTFTIITGEPIIKGAKGGRKLMNYDTHIEYEYRPEFNKETLAGFNLSFFDDLLNQTIITCTHKTHQPNL